jgi:Family of unknown function (DUF6594)
VLQQAKITKFRDAKPEIINILYQYLRDRDSLLSWAKEFKHLKGSLEERDIFCLTQEEMTPLERFLHPLAQVLAQVLVQTLELNQLESGLTWRNYLRMLKFRLKRAPGSEEDLDTLSPVEVKALAGVILQGITKVLMMVTGIGMLIAPIWTLYAFHDPRVKLGVITGFIVAFLLIVAVSTRVDPSATLASTAG